MAVITGSGRVLGTENADEVTGGNGSDTLLGGGGNDTLNGGFDVDFAEYSTSPGLVEALLSAGTVTRDGTGGTDTLVGIEGIIGSLNDDVIVGSAQADVLLGLGGADTINGGAGDDLLRGGNGNDQITGGAGIDTAFFGDDRSGYTITAVSGGFVVTDNAPAGEDDGSDTVIEVEYFSFNDVLFAAEEVLNPAANRPTAGDDSLFGGARADRIDALAGNDTVDAGGGDDTLVGGPGNDFLGGGAGFDTALFGDAGFRGATPRQSGGGLVLATSAGTDTLAGVEEVRFADGRLVLNAADPAAKVARLYEAALDRLPDQGGLNFWTTAVQNGEPLSSLASGFLASPEFQARFGGATAGNGPFVDQLYLNVLGRAGEAEGRAFWVGALEGGAARRAEVLAAFSESAENQVGTAGLVQNGIWDRNEAAAQVARLYDTVFGRLPDLPGLVVWKDVLESGRATPAQVADAFVGSTEFQARYGALENRGFANALYVNTLDRPADQAGLDFWTAALDAGTARSGVVLAFSESAEHTNLTASNIQSENPTEFGILFA
ncbi:MAG: DUF4214 domain-containing protein [Acetobacteraceae bacterium]|nr:DUF4214 domain-containing protein [Acetobacteraceae bacterium]